MTGMDFHAHLPAWMEAAQNRLFLALAGLVCAVLFDALRGAVLRNRCDPRPVMERLAALIQAPVVTRMNRVARAESTLILRGFAILAFTCVLFFIATAFLYQIAREAGQGGAFLSLLVAASAGTLGWFAPLRALAVALGDPKAPRPYMMIARAVYGNLITLDDSGMIRVAATAAISSLLVRLAAPVLIFVVAGWQGLALYWPVAAMALAAGRDGTDRAFALIANGLTALLLILPALVLFPVLLLALFLSAGSSFFRALPALFGVGSWPPLVMGGPSLMLVAYAMKLMLGGPRQTMNGTPVPAPWVGPKSGTARLTPRDIGRILYLQAVALLLFASLLYLLSIA